MRKSGVLMHISSLPCSYGIGTLGKSSRDFIDFLKAAGQTYWQVLPVCPTGYGDSPYQSFCCEAGNPYFIDLDELCCLGLLEKKILMIHAGAKSHQGLTMALYIKGVLKFFIRLRKNISKVHPDHMKTSF